MNVYYPQEIHENSILQLEKTKRVVTGTQLPNEMHTIPGKYEAIDNIFLIEDIHACVSFSLLPERNKSGF